MKMFKKKEYPSKEFYYRLAKDFDLPFNIFDRKMIDYYKKNFSEIWPTDKEALLHNSLVNYNVEMNKFNEYLNAWTDGILKDIENSDEYKAFNESDMSRFYTPDIFDNNGVKVGNRQVYTKENVGNVFMSIDLKKANFQALKFVGVIGKEYKTYEQFIERKTGNLYLPQSKHKRQVLFGKLNPKRIITVEKFMMYILYKNVKIRLEENGWGHLINLYSINSDELIFKYEYDSEQVSKMMVEKISDIINQISISFEIGFDVKIEHFRLDKLDIVTENGAEVPAYVKHNVLNGKETLKKVPGMYFPQVYKLWKGKKITKKDRMFYYEGQVCYFNKPLKISQNEDISN